MKTKDKKSDLHIYPSGNFLIKILKNEYIHGQQKYESKTKDCEYCHCLFIKDSDENYKELCWCIFFL